MQDNATHIGVVGSHSLDGGTLSTTDWANFPVGYRAMIHSNNGTTYGSPVNNYGYFLKVANRDTSGGWGGIWVGYSTGENYLGRTGTSGSYASWEKIWTSGNDGSGSGLDADLLDGVQGSSFLRSDTADTISAQLTMGTQTALVASNHGHGVFGVYSASKYQHVWSMGTNYKGPADGASTGSVGNLYGLAWSYNPDYGAVGNNAQSKTGLSHQLLLTMNGITKTALGDGIWTNGHVTMQGTKRLYLDGGCDTYSVSYTHLTLPTTPYV